MSTWEFLNQQLGNSRKREWKHSLVYFFVWFADFNLKIVEWSGLTKKMNF